MTGTRVAVVGAGLMGTGIAQVLSAAGHAVALFDPDEDARAAALPAIDRVRDRLGEGGAPVAVHAALEDAVRGAGLVVEAGPEDLAVKRAIFERLLEAADPAALLATNTSAIPVAHIADGLPTAERILGMHFWNPPYLLPLVEVVQGEATSDAAVEQAMALLRAARMAPVHVRADVPGFIGNRLQHALKREAIALVAAGICSAEDVDTVTKHGFGARLPWLGPLEQSDLVGLELTLRIHETLMPALDVTREPHPLLVEKVRRGDVGAAAGRGFRDWTPQEAQAARERATAGLMDARRRWRNEEEERWETG